MHAADATSVWPDGVHPRHGPISASKRPPKVRPEDSEAGSAWRSAEGPPQRRRPRIETSASVVVLWSVGLHAVFGPGVGYRYAGGTI